MYDHDDDHASTIDPQLRLHSVRTAASAIAESIKVEERQERRAKQKRRFFSFRRRGTGDSTKKSKLAAGDTQSVRSGVTTATVTEDGKMAAVVGKEEEKKEEAIKGSRRNIYVNYPLPAHELDTSGDPLARYPRNKVRTTSEFFSLIFIIYLFYLMLTMLLRIEYTIVSFIPKNLYEQFRRVANLFFLTLVVLQRASPPPSSHSHLH